MGWWGFLGDDYAQIFFKFVHLFKLEANYFTILWWVLPYIDMEQPWCACFPIFSRSSSSHLYVFFGEMSV